jgi:hypothetical protein
MGKSVLVVLVLLMLSGTIASSVGAQSFTFSKVADHNTPIPGGSGNFTFFYYRLVIAGNYLVFSSYDPGGTQQEGIYLFDGTTLGVVADRNTPIPGRSVNFYDFEAPVVSGGRVAFLGGSGYGTQKWIYLFDGTTLSNVADFNTSIPGGSGTFLQVNAPVISGSNVAFEGFGSSGQQGIYLFDGTMLSKIADLNTAIPGGTGNFISFDYLGISAGKVSFYGEGPSGQRGIYLFNGATLNKIADLNTAIPEGSGNFMGIGYPVISGNNVAFGGFGFPVQQEGIYLSNGTTLRKVADLNTAIPGGSGNFTSFSRPPVISGGNVAFTGVGSSGQGGIYLFNGTTLVKVVDFNTPVPEGSGKFTILSPPVISGSNVAFGGSGGSYLFNGATLTKVADSNTPIPEGSGNFYAVGWPVISGSDLAFFGFGSLGQEGIYLAVFQPSPSTTVLVSSPNPSTFGQPVTFTATVSAGPPGTGTPTGTVAFLIDSNPVGSPVLLDGAGMATLTISTLAGGSHTITAIYSGDVNFTPSTGSTTVKVFPGAAVPTLTEWGMILLTVLLGISSVFYLRKRRSAI